MESNIISNSKSVTVEPPMAKTRWTPQWQSLILPTNCDHSNVPPMSLDPAILIQMTSPSISSHSQSVSHSFRSIAMCRLQSVTESECNSIPQPLVNAYARIRNPYIVVFCWNTTRLLSSIASVMIIKCSSVLGNWNLHCLTHRCGFRNHGIHCPGRKKAATGAWYRMNGLHGISGSDRHTKQVTSTKITTYF